jgi:hypothetical protein
VDGIEAAGERTVDRLARAGFLGKGALYLVLGLLAGRLARPGGVGGEDASQQGAIRAVAEQPFGRVLVAVLAVGLTGYAGWRAVQAIRGVRPDASELPAWLARVTFGVRSLLYGALAVLAWSAVAGARGTGPATESSVTAMALGWPGGRIAVAVVGLVIVGVGVYQLREGWSCGFREHLDLGTVSSATARGVEWIGRIGHIARGVVFLAAGWFLLRAAWTFDADTGVGLDAALGELVAAPLGAYVLAGLAGGLILYGVYCLVAARYVRPSRAT